MNKTGEFNLTFPGATIVCDTLQKRAALLNYLNGKANNFEIDVDFCDIEHATNNVVYNTTYYHECKHVHDHLSCPFLVHNYSLKLGAMYHAIMASHAWKQGKYRYKYIPLPFLSWLETPIEKQLHLIEKKGLDPYDVPVYSLQQAAQIITKQFVTEEYFIHFLLLGAICYSEFLFNTSINEPDSYNTEYSPKTFIESMAFVHQMTQISLKYGDKGEAVANRIVEDSFENFINLGERRRNSVETINECDYIGYTTYTSMFTMVYRYLIHSKINLSYLFSLTSYLLFWALSGNMLHDPKQAVSPRQRIEKLFHLSDLGIDLKLNDDNVILTLLNSPLELFKVWDKCIADVYNGSNYRVKQETGGLYYLNSTSSPIDIEEFFGSIIQKESRMSFHLANMGYSMPAEYILNIANATRFMYDKVYGSLKSYLYPQYYSTYAPTYTQIPFRVQFVGIEPIKEYECSRIRAGVSFKEDFIYCNSLYSYDAIDHPSMINWHYYIGTERFLQFCDSLYNSSVPSSMLIKEFFPGIKTWFFKNTSGYL